MRKTALFKPSEWEELEERLNAINERLPQSGKIKLATLMHDLTVMAIKGQLPLSGLEAGGAHPADVGGGGLILHDLGTAPCGPLQEAIDAAHDFEISRDIANVLQAVPGDLVIKALEDSMEGAGIYDGMLVVMSPLAARVDPPRDKIALVQVVVDGLVYKSTIKRWKKRLPNNGALLWDGNDEPYALPEDTEQVIPVATVKGVIGQLG